MKKKVNVKAIIAHVILMVMIVVFFSGCTASCEREIKSLSSDWNGGLDRTVSVYSYNGELIKSWSGKFDVSESENEMYFDVGDKRVIIQGGIIINEEN